MKIFLKHSKRFPKNNQGFTLVELLVVFFIMATIMAMILPDYFAYQENIDLNNIAHEVALSIREAQVYGFGAKVDPGTFSFDYPYGIEFDTGDPTSFKLFIDKTTNNGYIDSPSTDPCNGSGECIQKYTLKNGFTISDICVAQLKTGVLDYKCKSVMGSGVTDLKWLDITYMRPDPDARIMAYDGSRVVLNASSIDNQARGKIIISSESGKNAIVVVSLSGRVSVGE